MQSAIWKNISPFSSLRCVPVVEKDLKISPGCAIDVVAFLELMTSLLFLVCLLLR